MPHKDRKHIEQTLKSCFQWAEQAGFCVLWLLKTNNNQNIKQTTKTKQKTMNKKPTTPQTNKKTFLFLFFALSKSPDSFFPWDCKGKWFWSGGQTPAFDSCSIRSSTSCQHLLKLQFFCYITVGNISTSSSSTVWPLLNNRSVAASRCKSWCQNQSGQNSITYGSIRRPCQHSRSLT